MPLDFALSDEHKLVRSSVKAMPAKRLPRQREILERPCAGKRRPNDSGVYLLRRSVERGTGEVLLKAAAWSAANHGAESAAGYGGPQWYS